MAAPITPGTCVRCARRVTPIPTDPNVYSLIKQQNPCKTGIFCKRSVPEASGSEGGEGVAAVVSGEEFA